MIRRRNTPDGLPYRVYERHGKRVYSIGHKGPSGAWTFRLQCPGDDRAQIAEIRREAIKRAADIRDGAELIPKNSQRRLTACADHLPGARKWSARHALDLLEAA